MSTNTRSVSLMGTLILVVAIVGTVSTAVLGWQMFRDPQGSQKIDSAVLLEKYEQSKRESESLFQQALKALEKERKEFKLFDEWARARYLYGLARGSLCPARWRAITCASS
jgi:hypothetical protein